MASGSVGERIVIVGGGIIGSSIAFHLAERGYTDVVIVEENLVGEGATAFATGGIRQQFSTRVNIRLAQDSIPFWSEFEDRIGSPLAFRQHGYLFLLSDPAVHADFQKSVALQRELGVQVETISPSQVSDLFPGTRTDDLLGATYTPLDGSASPTDALTGYLKAARRNGVIIEQRTSLRGLQYNTHGELTGVITSEGRIRCDTVIIAAGPQARRVGQRCGVDIPVYPHSRQAFATGPIPGLDGSMPLTVDMATGAYVHPEASGGVAIVGGNDRDVPSTDQARVDWTRVESLAEVITSRFPGLDDLEIIRGWAGLREMTPDDHAIVGPVESVPGLWVAAGFSGHGFMQSPAVGRAMAEWLIDGAPSLDISALSLSRFGQAAVPALETAVF